MSDLLTVIFWHGQTCVGDKIATASLQVQVQTSDALKSVPAPPVAPSCRLQWPACARMQDKGLREKAYDAYARTPREFIFALGHKPHPDKALELLSVVNRECKIYMQMNK